MSLAKTVNKTLGRHLGIEVKRATSEFPRYYDDAACAVMTRVRPRTMTSNEKLHALILATRHVCQSNIPGAVVECGVWRGGSMQAIAWTLAEQGQLNRDLYLFDTFEGMPPPDEFDSRVDGLHAAELLTDNTDNVKAYATRSDVELAMIETNYAQERIHLIEGMVEDTLPGQAPENIALLRLDTDWYASTKHELNTLYDRLVPGGVLILDDYGWWQGSRKAVDEWLHERKIPLFLAPMAEGRIAIKP